MWGGGGGGGRAEYLIPSSWFGRGVGCTLLLLQGRLLQIFFTMAWYQALHTEKLQQH